MTIAANTAIEACLNVARVDPLNRDLYFIIDPRVKENAKVRCQLAAARFRRVIFCPEFDACGVKTDDFLIESG
jgi:hypothetical protein